MLKLIILTGLPASGKSTWAKEFISKNPDYRRINKDDIRNMVINGAYSYDSENQILEIRNFIIENYLKNNLSVIVDDTNFNQKHINTLSNIANKYNATIEIKEFNISLEESVRRDSARGKASVGKDVIFDLWNKYIKPKRPVIQYNELLEDAIIVDIDGTISDKFPGRGPYDYNLVDLDSPKENIIKLIQILETNYKIIFVTARENSCYEKTQNWINLHCNLINDYILLMKQENDDRKDFIVKEEIYNNEIKDKFNIIAVFDDRDVVVDLYRNKLGLTCLQIDYGTF